MASQVRDHLLGHLNQLHQLLVTVLRTYSKASWLVADRGALASRLCPSSNKVRQASMLICKAKGHRASTSRQVRLTTLLRTASHRDLA